MDTLMAYVIFTNYKMNITKYIGTLTNRYDSFKFIHLNRYCYIDLCTELLRCVDHTSVIKLKKFFG